MAPTPQPNRPGTVLVTGGAKRLGAAIAVELAEAGWDVVVHYRTSRDAAEALAADLRTKGRRSWTLSADLGDPAACRPLIERAAALNGGLEALVCNASIFEASTLFDTSAEDLQSNVQVHAVAPMLLARAFSELPNAQHILTLLDSKITGPDEEHLAYHLSKRMLADLTRSLAVALAPDIAVNGIAPGAVLPAPGKTAAEFAVLAREVPLKKTGSPADIARAARFLLGSDFVTGQILFVDGGRHLHGNLYG